jgi:hypothetical protein
MLRLSRPRTLNMAQKRCLTVRPPAFAASLAKGGLPSAERLNCWHLFRMRQHIDRQWLLLDLRFPNISQELLLLLGRDLELFGKRFVGSRPSNRIAQIGIFDDRVNGRFGNLYFKFFTGKDGKLPATPVVIRPFLLKNEINDFFFKFIDNTHKNSPAPDWTFASAHYITL